MVAVAKFGSHKKTFFQFGIYNEIPYVLSHEYPTQSNAKIDNVAKFNWPNYFFPLVSSVTWKIRFNKPKL